MNGKRIASFVLGFFVIFLTLPGAQLLPQNGGTGVGETNRPSVDRDEIKSPEVDFVNRSNVPFTPAQRRAEINSGGTMADEVVENQRSENNGITIRRVFNRESDKYGADIITIQPNSSIGHINRVERVLTGYLMKAFEYDENDAAVIARFVLYYNANNRGNMSLITEKYSEEVAAAVAEEKLGIDRTYRNWAGNTQMVLPLRKSAVRPGETDLNNKEIEDETKNAEDSEKKEFEEITDDRREDEQEKLDQKDDELKKQQEDLKKQEEELKKQQEQAESEREDTGRRLEELRDDPNADPADVKEAEEAVKEAEKKQEEIAKKQEEVQKQQEETQQKQEEVKEQQQEVAEETQKDQQEETAVNTNTDDTNANTTTDTTDTTGDQKDQEENKPLEKEEEVSDNVVQDKILFMRVLRYTNDGHYNNELWFIDAAANDALKRSSYTKICSRDFIVVPDTGVLVTGYIGEVDDPSQHRLVMLDTETLDKSKESAERVYWDTPMIIQDGKIYAIMEKDGEFFLARFNTDLTLDAQSSDPVSPYSDITFYKEKIYLTGKPRSGDKTTIQVFNKADLKIQKTIEPPAQSASR